MWDQDVQNRKELKLILKLNGIESHFLDPVFYPQSHKISFCVLNQTIWLFVISAVQGFIIYSMVRIDNS